MIVWIFVEGRSDELALSSLFQNWRGTLRNSGHGIRVIPLQSKSQYFKNFGSRAAEKLENNASDLVVGLPDLYPNTDYLSTEWKHDDLDELKDVQKRLVDRALDSIYAWSKSKRENALTSRFFPSAFKHDCEMLLLAAEDQLRAHLKTKDRLGRWMHPVEEQNQNRPPKRIVEDLFHRYLGREYRDTVHAKGVLDLLPDLRSLLFDDRGQSKCPVFKGVIDWIATQTGVPAYSTGSS